MDRVAARQTSIGALPPEILQHICKLLQDPPYDLASAHLVDTRFCDAARSALHGASPQDPGFLQLALRHNYPLRQLNATALPSCDLGSYLTKAPSSLTSLDLADQWHNGELGNMLRGISSLRHLSCKVHKDEDNLDFLQAHLSGLATLSVVIMSEWDFGCYQGLTHLQNLTGLTVEMFSDDNDYCAPFDTVARLTTLRELCVPQLDDPPLLSALGRLTALGLGGLSVRQPTYEDDEDIAALVRALPQLHVLHLMNFAASATDAGLGQQSGFENLQELSMTVSFEHCTHNGLVAALSTMTGLASLDLSYIPFIPFMTQHAMATIAQRTSLTALYITELVPREYGSAVSDMLQALGPRLQRLAIGYDIYDSYNAPGHYPDQCTAEDSLAPLILRHCSQLAELTLEHDMWPGDIAEGMVFAPLKHCTQLNLYCPSAAEASVLTHVPRLSSLQLRVGSTVRERCKFDESSLAALVTGLRCLEHLQHLRIDIREVGSDPLLGVLEAAACCTRLASLDLGSRLPVYLGNACYIGAGHLSALAALSQLTMLCFARLPWTEEALELGLEWLRARLPRLRVLDVAKEVQATSCEALMRKPQPVAGYGLSGLPRRPLKRWP